MQQLSITDPLKTYCALEVGNLLQGSYNEAQKRGLPVRAVLPRSRNCGTANNPIESEGSLGGLTAAAERFADFPDPHSALFRTYLRAIPPESAAFCCSLTVKAQAQKKG